MNHQSIDALNLLEDIVSDKNAVFKHNHKQNRDRIELNGFAVSVQASSYHYCRPREDAVGSTRYTHLELGYPAPMTDEDIELIGGYAEDKTDYTGTVYGWVPVEIVRKLIMSWTMD